MSSYRGTVDSPDQAKAVAAVVVVHVALAAVILSGLNVAEVRNAVEQFTTISISQPPPPPPPVQQPRPAPKPETAKHPAGVAAKQAEPTPIIIAPQPKLSVPSPVAAAKVAGTGAAPSSGGALAGNGTGAGGSGAGTGGGGYGDTSHFTPARLVSNIPNSEYRRLAATGIPSGAVGVTILVGPNGAVSSCRIARSSGDPAIDALVCQLTQRYVRFDPPRDPYGRPVAQDVTYFPSWRRR